MIETILAIVGAMGGIELVKLIVNRRTNARLADAEADSAELATIKDVNQFLQEQLRDKEERFAEQTERLRETQSNLFSEREARHKAELELALKRCNKKGCTNREPQNGY